MGTRRMTNWLLLGILLVLLADLGRHQVSSVAVAETFKMDSCITSLPGRRPEAYVHVVTHDFAGE